MKLKKSSTASTAFLLLAFAMSAEAGWTGFYTGLNGGYGFGEQQTDLAYLPTGSTSPNTLTPSLDGGVFGGQIGFDWVFAQRFVLGLKYDMDWSGLSSSASTHSVDSFSTASIFSTSENLTWFGNLLPRLGFLPLHNLLIYGTAGLSFGHINGSADQDFTVTEEGINHYPGSINTTIPGWSAGAGLEWLIGQHWSLSTEYMYNELKNQSTTVDSVPASPPYQNQYTFKTNFQTMELAVNYRF